MSRPCVWCAAPLVRRAKEGPAAFARRRYCSVSCSVSGTNAARGRALRARREAEDATARLSYARSAVPVDVPAPLWEEK